MSLYKGHILVASSSIFDDHFHQSVVFLVNHNENGAFGFVVNKPGLLKLGDMIDQIKTEARNRTVMRGGPIRNDALFVLHSDSTIGSSADEIIPGVFIGYDFDLLIELCSRNTTFQVYHGYSAWAAGQLEKEMAAKSWIPMEADANIVFHENPPAIWREALLKKGGLFSYFAAKVKDPILN